MRLKLTICLLLAGITLAVYWPARHFDIIYYDDPYFVMSEEVGNGLNWHGLAWAMTGVVVANWHPVTNLSFLITHQFFGFNPGAEHLVNVFFHSANAALMFLVMWQFTGAIWRSALVAAIFAWHPQRVESVAWIAERKDVLFVFFMLLSLWCYARYARTKENENVVTPRWNLPYILALLFFALSLMSKAMSVTLPFLMLLLDFWPLGRFQGLPGGQRTDRPTLKGLVIEKIPFFALAILFSAVTFWVQRQDAAVVQLEKLRIVARFENAALSYLYYLGDFFWPTKLSIFYQYTIRFNVVEVWLTGLLLLAISTLCILEIQRRPYLAMGWLWYLVTMVPVIGLVQVGIHSMSDHYTYISMVGPVMSLVWLSSEWARPKVYRALASTGAILVIAACIFLTRKQLQYWQNSVTLFQRAITLSPRDPYPHLPLALGLEEQGRWREATIEYQIALTMKIPQIQFVANLHYANALEHMGYRRQANQFLEAALKIEPDTVKALNDLAWSLATDPDARFRDGSRAVKLAERACELTGYQETQFIGTLGAAYAEAGRYDDAVATAQKAIANARQQGQTDLAERNQELLQLYQQKKAYHE